MSFERVEIGPHVLYRADFRDVLQDIGRVDAVVSDPPYGQGLKTNAGVIDRNARTRATGSLHRTKKAVLWPEGIHGDDQPFDPAPWLEIAPTVLLWGAHKFYDRLPAGGSMLAWDKVPTGKTRDQGDGEIAWLNRPGPMRIFRLLWDGVCVGSGARHEVTAGQQRVHPTQKPEILMRWCLEKAGLPPVVLDPYAGAGSTIVACQQLGLSGIGVEIEPLYFDTMCKRVEDAYAQRSLFIETPRAPAEQFDLLGESS